MWPVYQMYLHVFGKTQQVVVGDGWFTGTGGTDKQTWPLVRQEGVQEETLSGRLIGLNNQVTHLQAIRMVTVKFLNIRTPRKFAVIILKLEQYHFTTLIRLFLNQSSLIWVYTICPDLSGRKLRNITVR